MHLIRMTAGVAMTLMAGWALAFGAAGHRTVGAMADRLIAGSRAEQEVAALLNRGESLESIATWADCAKGNCGRLTLEMQAFVAANPKHRSYHYTDLPFQAKTYRYRAVGSDELDVVHILKQCIHVLGSTGGKNDNPHRFTKRQALLLLVHLVGDIHQPLHVGTAYMDKEMKFVVPLRSRDIDNRRIFTTYGDNDLMIGKTTLHSYWDSKAVTYAMRAAKAKTPARFAAHLIRRYPQSRTYAGQATEWPAKWATQSLAQSRDVHHSLEVTAREEDSAADTRGRIHYKWQVTAPRDYSATASKIATEQLARAGLQLAAVLQAIWP